MARFHLVMNAGTGETSQVAFTSEEESAADAGALAHRFGPLTRIQFKFMVRKLGLNAAIPQAIAALPSGTEAETDFKLMAETLWEDGDRFERAHPLFSALGPALGLTSEQIDEAWLAAMAV